MSSKASGSSGSQKKLTWYGWGEEVPDGRLGEGLNKMVIDHIKTIMPNLVPTTYKEAFAYLEQETKKKEGERDLLREMCLILPLKLPEDRKVILKSDEMKTLIELHQGSMMILPTIALPPDSFGSPQNSGFLNSKDLIYDPPTRVLQEGLILQTYYTKSGPDVKGTFPEGSGIQLDHSPFR